MQYNLHIQIILTNYFISLSVDKSIQTPSYIDKCSLLDDISRDFSKMLDEDVNHDVEFTCGDLAVKAHKSVLCCRSEVFASMLQADMVESQTGRVNIVDMEATFFQELLKFLYTGIVPELTLSSALQFYSAGDKYNIGTLKKQCAEFLIDNLSPENACDTLIVADRHSDANFKNSIIEYMMVKKIPFGGDKWADFCKENPVLATEVLNLFCQNLRPK